MLRVALLHYWLTNLRGGEKVLAELAGLYPDADIFTHAYDASKMAGVFGKHKIYETFIGKLPLGRKHCQKYLPLMPLALQQLNLDAYNLIISSESGPIKGIRKPAGAKHICYCHTPMRYLWDMYDDYYHNTGFSGKIAMSLFKSYLRSYDLKSVDSVDYFIANSNFVRERIKRIYGRESVVIHPPVNTVFFQSGKYEKKDYYVYAGQLIPYKHPELAVQACRKLGRRLVVIGNGNMKEELQCIADPGITFLGRASDEDMRRCYAEAQALIFPGVEDFGIVPVEAQAAGTPVIALGKGGALETVTSNTTGLFFQECKVESLVEAILEFESRTWDSQSCRKHADQFSNSVFRHKMQEFVESVSN